MKKHTTKQQFKSNAIKLLGALFLTLFSFNLNAQIFWTENFNNGCTQLCNLSGYVSAVNGPWTMSLGPGNIGTDPNEWFVSCAENGNALGVGGSDCTNPSGCGVASPSNATLHVGNISTSPAAFVFCPFGDCGAAYDAGLFGGNVETDKRAESPTINCTGHVGIILDFKYMSGGVPGVDNALVEYSDDNGLTWNFLATPNVTALCAGTQGIWTAYNFNLPASCDNNPNVKIGFHWVNDDDGFGTDPSFAVDDVTLSSPVVSNTITTGVINPLSVCACSTLSVPFTSTGTYVAGNVYKAQLSDAFGSFAAPTNIGTLSSTANSGTISCTIPCNTPAGTGYLIQVISSNPSITGTNNGVNITINPVQDSTFSYSSSSYCQAGSDPSASITGVAGGTFTATPAGLMFLNTTTGQIDVSASTVGTYSITYTTPGPCLGTMTVSISITGTPDASFNYASASYCQNNADPNPTFTGTGTAGTFSAVPATLVFVSAGTGQIDLSASTPGNYVVTNTVGGVGGCPIDTATFNITINAAQDSTFAYPSSTFCQSGTNAVPVISGTLGGTFTSSPATLVFVNTTSGEINLAGSPLGTYSVTYTTPGPCASSLTVSVTITTAPVATFSYTASPYCQSSPNPSPTFSGGASAGTFTASPAGLTFISPTTGQVDLLNSVAGTYTVTNTIAASGGCLTASATSSITIIATPAATFSYIGNPYCTAGLNPSPTFSGGGIAGTFTATPAGLNIVPNTGAVTLNASTPGTYVVTNTITNAGCPNSVDTATIVIVSAQVATFGYNGSPYCIGTGNVSPTYSGGGIAGNFTAAPAGLSINATTGVVNLATSGAGTYVVTNNIAASTSCPSASDTSTIVINATPTVTVNSGTICNGTAFSFSANGATSYSWSAGATSTGTNTATASPTLTTSYTVTGTTGTCSDTAISIVTVQVCNPPIAAFTGTPLVICNSGCVTFTDQSTNLPTSWLWSFPGGIPATANTQDPGQVCYASLGQYTVILIVTNSTGADTLIMPNYISVVAPIPVSISPANPTVNACESVDLTASPPGSSYTWGPNYNLTCGDCQIATVAPDIDTRYWVLYNDVNGCYSTDTVDVTVTQIFTYFMPTGFSPNGDYFNDSVVVHGKGIKYINLKIFDRIGEKVFETSDILTGWDGTLHGLPMNENAFVYQLSVTYCNGQTVKENGSLTLVK